MLCYHIVPCIIKAAQASLGFECLRCNREWEAKTIYTLLIWPYIEVHKCEFVIAIFIYLLDDNNNNNLKTMNLCKWFALLFY